MYRFACPVSDSESPLAFLHRPRVSWTPRPANRHRVRGGSWVALAVDSSAVQAASMPQVVLDFGGIGSPGGDVEASFAVRFAKFSLEGGGAGRSATGVEAGLRI